MSKEKRELTLSPEDRATLAQMVRWAGDVYVGEGSTEGVVANIVRQALDGLAESIEKGLECSCWGPHKPDSAFESCSLNA